MDSIDVLLYMPASFVCDKCGFRMEKRTLLAATGEVGIREGGEEPDPCLNDGEPMRRVTWKEAYEESAKIGHELMLALIESVKFQSHYAGILNDYDGGKRLQFSCPADWIHQLVKTGVIPKKSMSNEIKKPVFGPILLERECDNNKCMMTPEEIAERIADRLHNGTNIHWGCGVRFRWYFGMNCECPGCGMIYQFTNAQLRSRLFLVDAATDLP